ncbi:MAG: SGNH/GDSL hydrolase family protein [Oscillospiraceae bacterium]
MLYKLRGVLIVCAIFLIVAIGIILALVIGFKPTETHAFGNGESSSVLTESTSEPISEESSTVSESTVEISSSTESSDESSVSEPEEKPKAENNPRLKELQYRLTYGENWKLRLSENQKALAADSLFVGDSICSGFGAYGLVDWRNVYAAGSVGARNFFTTEMKYFGEVKTYDVVLAEKNPKRVFTWMGMNDVNMTSSAKYADNYKAIIDYTLEHCEAEVYVFAMTPVNSDFTPNERIVEFNTVLKTMVETNYTERVHFIDFAYVVTDSLGMLCEDYDAGDGVHLAPDVYYLAMIEICDQLGIPS